MKKNFSMLIFMLTAMYMICFFGSIDTAAYFTSETVSKGHIVNATTNDLLSIKPAVKAYDKNGVVQINMEVTNLSSVSIPIRFADIHETVKPGETVTKTVQKMVSADMKTVQIRIVGFNHYIDERVQIPIDGNKLVTSEENQEQASKEDLPADEKKAEKRNDSNKHHMSEEADGTDQEQGQGPEQDLEQKQELDPEQDLDQEHGQESDQKTNQDQQQSQE